MMADADNAITEPTLETQSRVTLLKRRWFIGAAILLVVSVSAIGAGAYWVWRSVREQANTPIVVTAEQAEQQKLHRLVASNAADADSFTSEDRELFEPLGAELAELDDEFQATLRKLREVPFLNRALQDSRTTPLIGSSPPRIMRDRLASYERIVDILLIDFDQRNGSDAVTPLRKDLSASLLNLLCFRKRDKAINARLFDEYTSGNKDPLLIYTLGKVFDFGMKRSELWADAFDSRGKNQCCPLLHAMIGANWNEVRTQRASLELATLQSQARQDLFSVVKEYGSDPEFAHVLLTSLVSAFEASNNYGKGEILSSAVSAPAESFPRWMTHYLAFDWLRLIAKRHRGTHFINDVSDVDLDNFRRFGDDAIRHLMKAWCLNANDPQLVRELLNHQNWSGGTPLRNHEWFRIGVALQSDDEDLFTNYALSLQPKWGGSNEKLVEVANLVANATEFECPAPLYSMHFLRNALEAYGQRATNDNLAMLKPAIQCVEFLRKYPEVGDAHLTNRIVLTLTRILWDWGQLNELNWLMERYPANMTTYQDDRLAFSHTSLYREFAQAAQQGDYNLWKQLHLDLFVASERLSLNQLQIDRLMITELRDQADDSASRTLDVCEQLISWRTQFELGDPVAIEFDQRLLGLAELGMPCKPWKNGFESSVDNNSNQGLATLLVKFPVPFSVSARLEQDETEADFFGVAMFVGPMNYAFKLDGVKRGGVIRIQAMQDLVFTDQLPGNMLGFGEDNNRYFEGFADSGYLLRMDVRRMGIDYFVNDKLLFSAPIKRFEPEGLVQFGRYTSVPLAQFDSQQTTIRVSDIKIVKLPE